MATTDTKHTLMMAARAMVQSRGYNALSYRELGKEIGIKSSSIHYYFPSKGNLGAALAHEYTDDFLSYLNDMLTTSPDWKHSINSYADVFRATLVRENRMCLGGIMAAEHTDLDEEIRVEVERFTELLVQWLTGVLQQGNESKTPEALRKWAFGIFAAIEGAQLVARGCSDVTVYDNILEAYRTTGLLP
ncbi:MAG: transcriptional regulator, TetR family [Pseudomonas sp.]|nr:transcriptional regulator, TetR family [Pseudomonas sp.]